MFDPTYVPPGPMHDFHIHPDYSFDARGSIDDYCKKALETGLAEICFTTHYDADPKHFEREGFMKIDGQRVPLSDDTVKIYLDDIARAYKKYGAEGLMVRHGVEVGYYDGCEKEISRLFDKFDFYFRMGAVHNIDELCVCCKESAQKLFSQNTIDQFADKYFERLERCAASGLFECLAHIDVYRRFGLEYYGDAVNQIHHGRIEKVFAAMQATRTGFELNTSAARHGHKEYYPMMEIINMARAAGVTLVSMGSDAHQPEQLALDFQSAASIAYELFPYVDE